jgi:hypothetical protein
VIVRLGGLIFEKEKVLKFCERVCGCGYSFSLVEVDFVYVRRLVWRVCELMFLN